MCTLEMCYDAVYLYSKQLMSILSVRQTECQAKCLRFYHRTHYILCKFYKPFLLKRGSFSVNNTMARPQQNSAEVKSDALCLIRVSPFFVLSTELWVTTLLLLEPLTNI